MVAAEIKNLAALGYAALRMGIFTLDCQAVVVGNSDAVMLSKLVSEHDCWAF